MINEYDLYDLHAIFVSIRFSPNNDTNYDVLVNVINVLNDIDNANTNQFRTALRTIEKLKETEIYSFVFTENKYCYFSLPFLKNKKIYQVLICACSELVNAIKEKHTEKVIALADCLHNLPILIVENKYSIPKSFWKEINTYRKKWNETFLLLEEKSFKKHKG